jgi:hypothetical protein
VQYLILQALGLETSSHFFLQKGNTEGTALFFNIHFSSENIRKDLHNDIFCHVNTFQVQGLVESGDVNGKGDGISK